MGKMHIGSKRPKVTLANYARFWDEGVEQKFQNWPIDQSLVNSLAMYVKERVPTGGFLRAVLENDLLDAVNRADLVNQMQLRNIANFVRTAVPAVAQGSPEKVIRWLTGVEGDE